MKNKEALVTAAAIYLLVQAIGLYISRVGPEGAGGMIDAVESGAVQPVIPGKQPAGESVAMVLFYVLVSTAIILLLMKYNFGLLIKILVYIGLAGGLLITLTGLLGYWGLLPALAILGLALWKKEEIVVRNVLLLFAIPGIASWMGASPALSSSLALVLILLLSIYDIIAVFWTKHMVTLAKGAKDDLPLMFPIPAGERILGLGTGDIALPLVFTVTVLKDYNMIHAVITALGGLIGLTALFIYILGKRDIVLPALPPITAGLILGYLVGILL